MSELNYSGGGGRPASAGAADAYASQAAPYQRNRYDQERWARIQADNAVMARKLGEVRREPPAGFHAPKGYKSVGQGRQAPGGKAQSGMPETLHYVPPTAWPPKEPAHEASRAAKQQREVSLANAHVAAKLRGIYKHRPDSFLEAHGLGAGFDCNDRWAQRTALYDSAVGGSGGGDGGLAAAGGGASGKTLDLEQASVPKSLGVAHCGGCGARCFYCADGPRLMRCRGCKAAWYCSEACAQLDYASHKAMCKYTTTGHWTPGGVRPPDEHWVNNAAMAVVRKQLRQRAAALAASGGGSSGSPPGGGGGGGGGSPGHSFGAGTGGGSVKGSPRVGGKAGGTRSPGGGAGKGVRASGIEPLAVEQMDGEMDVLFGLSARYKELRGMELQAEREQREVEWRADNGLDGPRPCMYQPRRFAPPPSGGQGGKGGKGGRPASAGAAVGRGGKPGWQDTASYL